MTLGEILSYLGDEVVRVSGEIEPSLSVTIDDKNHLSSSSLDWDQHENLLLFQDVKIKVRNAKVAIAMIGNHFLVKRDVSIHETAIIEPGAVIGENCSIGPYSIIRSCVKLGNGVVVESGCAIGNAGFGFVKKDDGTLLRFPQIGNVIIGDGVEIGSNCTIDRGALSDTVIFAGVKINSSVHIAHNVEIKSNTIITANVNVSGSSKIGRDVWIGPGTTIRDHVEIGDGAYIGIGSNIVKNVPPNETWCGNPARKMR